MGDTSKNNTTTGLVSSGSGQSVVKITDVPASQYASTNLSVDMASLLDSNTTLTYSQAANISKTQLNAADSNYTTAMNVLSGFWSAQDTTSDAYQQAKISAMEAENQWQLARDGLERVTATDHSVVQSSLLTNDAQIAPATVSAIDLTGASSTLVSGTSTTSTNDASTSSDVVSQASKTDARIRLRPKLRDANGQFPICGDSSSVLFGLNETNGVFFPFTPTISMSHRASYSQMTPTHSNTDYMIYNNSPAVQITIQGQFSSQNLPEAKYTLAAMHFFRTVTKMRFGETDQDAGLPPPVLVLSGYGEFMFSDLSVVVTEFTMDLPANVDYLEVDTGHGIAWVPSLTTFNINCTVQQTPRQQRENFNLDKFASGELLANKDGWI